MRTFKTIIRPVAIAVRSTQLYGRLHHSLDALLAPSRVDHMGSDSVLVCPPGNGNIGDAAMVEAFLDHSPHNVVLVTEGPSSFSSLQGHERVSDVVHAGPFFRSSALRRLRSTRQVADVISRAKDVAVIGADLMDGKYSARATLSRLSTLYFAKRYGVPSRILGFSFAEQPIESALWALKQMSKSSQLFARDPRSATRLRAAGVSSVIDSADIVFTQSEIRTSPPELEGLQGREFVVVNVSGLISTREPSYIDEVGKVISTIRARFDTPILFIPHVLTAPPHGDLGPTTDAYVRFGKPGDILVERELRPSEVREITKAAIFVFTGRMHLSVMSLSQGTPAFTLGTQGKVEGLNDLFCVPELSSQPTPGFSSSFETFLSTTDIDELRIRIRTAWPHVRQLAAKNFQ